MHNGPAHGCAAGFKGMPLLIYLFIFCTKSIPFKLQYIKNTYQLKSEKNLSADLTSNHKWRRQCQQQNTHICMPKKNYLKKCIKIKIKIFFYSCCLCYVYDRNLNINIRKVLANIFWAEMFGQKLLKIFHDFYLTALKLL